MLTYEFSVPGVTCSACTGSIDYVVEEARKEKKLTGIRSINIDLAEVPPRALVHVEEGLEKSAVKNELNELLIDVGFEFTDVVPTAIIIRQLILKGLLGLVTGSIMLGLCLSGLGLSMGVMYLIGFLCTALTFYLGKDTYQEAFKKLKAKQLTMHTLFSLSTLTALGISLLSFLVPTIPMMFDTALLIFGFIHLGKAYEQSTKRKVGQAASYRALAPAKISVRQANGKFQEESIYNIMPGSIIRVPQGGVIGLNGEYLPEDKSENSTTIINPFSGSNLPQKIEPYNNILAGSLVPTNVDHIDLRVTKSEEDSYLAFLEKNAKLTLTKKAPLQTVADKILQYFVPTVLFLALASAFTIGFLFTTLSALQVAATMLALACPCIFGLIIPLIIKLAIVIANTMGVQVAHGESLQAAAETEIIFFDLQGTLTSDEIFVSSGRAEQPVTNLSTLMLDYLAAIEQFSEHPFACAIQKYIYEHLKRPKRSNKKGIVPEVTLEETFHSGMRASIRGETYLVGNKALFLEQGFKEEDFKNADLPNHEAEHVIYLARNKLIQGCILLKNPLREGAAEVVRALQDQGKEVRFCTGASLETAEKHIRQLEQSGVRPIPRAHIYANCTPQDKQDHIEKLSVEGRKVAMIGDGLNDAPAFEKSFFSIAIESAQSYKLTQDTAGAVIHKDSNNELSLRAIPRIFKLADQTVKTIKQNLALSLSYNMVTMFAIPSLFIGFSFILNPALGAALMFIQSTLILAHVQYFKKKQLASLELDTNPAIWKSTDNQVLNKLPLSPSQFKKAQDDFDFNYGKKNAERTEKPQSETSYSIQITDDLAQVYGNSVYLKPH
ncbi:MAG TPA: HAD-IC family P-type ATPase [Gammaproteobacteria bacterium]|nr:HAD-IC family P-type ATPase [Gammaproteobacteria bacterium]